MPTAQAIISKSMRLLGAIASGESPTSVELSDGFDSLNSIIDSWSIAAPLNYCEQDESATLVASQGVYCIGNSSMTISGITRSSSTATATTNQAHGLETGCKVTVSGSTQTDYNVTAAITVTSPTTFTYTVANTPTSPGTGTPVFTSGDFVFPRPTTITGAFTRLASVDTPLSIITEGYWTNIVDKLGTSATVSRLMYRPSSPFGIIHLNPIPSGTPVLFLKYIRTVSAFSSLSHDQILPPGYRRLLELTLALEIAPEFQSKISSEVTSSLQTNLQAILTANSNQLASSVLTQPVASQ